MPVSVLTERILKAAEAAFLPDDEREQLVESLKADLQKYKAKL
jgi:hypothetical protein